MNTKNLIFIILAAAALNVIGKNARAQTIKPEDIREIVFEDGGGRCFDCSETTTLRADGTANKRGGRHANVFKGDYVGKIGADKFALLAREIVRAGFFGFKDRYEGNTDDAATIRILVAYRDGAVKRVADYAGSKEAEIKSVEKLIQGAALKIKWHSIGKTKIDDAAARSLAGIERFVEKMQAWTGDNVELVRAFGKLRERLGAEFEPAMWKYLGKNIERHYWISYYVEAPGDADALQLALLVRENAIRLLGKRTDETSLINRMSFGVSAAVGSSRLNLTDKAVQHKTAVERLRALPQEFPGFPAMFGDDLEIYERIFFKR